MVHKVFQIVEHILCSVLHECFALGSLKFLGERHGFPFVAMGEQYYAFFAFLGLGVWPISTINLSSVASSQVAKAQNASGR